MNLLQDIENARPDLPEEPPATVKLILKYAMRSFGQRGYSATTFRGIASEVGVSAPLLSYYFKSKKKLFLKVAEIVMTSLDSEVARMLDPRLSFYESIVVIVEAHTNIADRSPSAVEFMFAMMYGPREGQPHIDLTSMWAETHQRIALIFKRGIDSGEFVPRSGATIEFLVLQLGNLIHSHVSARFKAERFMARRPEEREEVSRRLDEASLDSALNHFFFGAGKVSGLRE